MEIRKTLATKPIAEFMGRGDRIQKEITGCKAISNLATPLHFSESLPCNELIHELINDPI